LPRGGKAQECDWWCAVETQASVHRGRSRIKAQRREVASANSLMGQCSNALSRARHERVLGLDSAGVSGSSPLRGQNSSHMARCLRWASILLFVASSWCQRRLKIAARSFGWSRWVLDHQYAKRLAIGARHSSRALVAHAQRSLRGNWAQARSLRSGTGVWDQAYFLHFAHGSGRLAIDGSGDPGESRFSILEPVGSRSSAWSLRCQAP
jgi:hypothetical protein